MNVRDELAAERAARWGLLPARVRADVEGEAIVEVPPDERAGKRIEEWNLISTAHG